MSRHHAQQHASAKRPDAPEPASAVVAPPTHAAIAQRAYDIYVKTGCQQGHCKQNWKQAEQSLHQQGAGCCQTEKG